MPCPHLARWPRQPDSHSGNAGSNPAGDTGPICRPVVFFGVPRLGDRACQFTFTVLFSLSRRPGIGLRTRLARFDSSQRGQSISAAFSRAAPCPCSRGTRHKPPKLVAQVRFLAGAPQGGTVPSGVHTPGSAGSIPAPATRGASGRAAALIRLSVEVRFLPSRLIWVWLNLAELRFRAPAIGGSNPLTQTARDEQAGECAGSTIRSRRVRSPGPVPEGDRIFRSGQDGTVT